jgi:hypothetical protein
MSDVDPPNPPGFIPPLGPEAEGSFEAITPGQRLKNAPEDYFHGSATGQVNYWRNRATTAEARIVALRREIEAMEAKWKAAGGGKP